MQFLHPTLILEIGVNHDGNIKEGVEIIRAIDRVLKDNNLSRDKVLLKFQSFRPTLASSKAEFANGKKQRPVLQQASKADLNNLLSTAVDYGFQYGITFFHEDDFAEVERHYNVDFYKIASPDIIATKMLALASYLAENCFTPVIISTGGATANEVIRAVSLAAHCRIGVIQAFRQCNIVVMACDATYPSVEFNFAAWRIATQALRVHLPYTNIHLGFSDHSNGVEHAHIARQLGAVVFEKHVYLNGGYDKDSSIHVDQIPEYIHVINESNYRRDRDSVAFTRRVWVATEKIKEGDKIIEGKNVEGVRHMTKEVFDEENHTYYHVGYPLPFVADRDYRKGDFIQCHILS